MLLEAMCIAIAIYGEARGESITGQVAVAEVVLERVEDPRWPDTACGVVFQPKQFSGVTKRVVAERKWEYLVPLAERVLLSGKTRFGANHFYSGRPPWWAGGMEHVSVIGGHTFLRDPPTAATFDVNKPVSPDVYESGTYAEVYKLPGLSHNCDECPGTYAEVIQAYKLPGLSHNCDECPGFMYKKVTTPRKSGIQFTGVKGSTSMRSKDES